MVGIYKITNKINGKVYIGQSVNIERRWNEHIKNYRNKKGRCKKVETDWWIYGESNFEFSIVEIIDISNLSKYDRVFILTYREQYNMEKYNTIKEGYNDATQFYRYKNKKDFNNCILPSNFYDNISTLMEIKEISNRITIL